MILLQKAADFAGAVFDGLARRVNRFGTDSCNTLAIHTAANSTAHSAAKMN